MAMGGGGVRGRERLHAWLSRHHPGLNRVAGRALMRLRERVRPRREGEEEEPGMELDRLTAGLLADLLRGMEQVADRERRRAARARREPWRRFP